MKCRYSVIGLMWLASPIIAAASPSETTPATVSAMTSIENALAAMKLDTAADLIERNVKVLPPAQLRLARAEYALASGDVDVAMLDYAALVGDLAVAARAHYGIGLIELRRGHDQLAAASLDAALTIDSSLIGAWIARGVAADRMRDWLRADTAYERALMLNASSADALANRGYSKLLRGQFADAAADSMLALAIDAKLTNATNNLLLARAMQGEYKTAFAGSTKMSLANDLNTVGFAAMSRGDYGIAETFFTRAMRLNSQFDHTAWDNLVYLKQLTHKTLDINRPQR